MIVYLFEGDYSYKIERSVLAKNPKALTWRDLSGKIIDATKIINVLDRISTDLYENFNEIYQVYQRKDVYVTDGCETMATDGTCVYLNPLWCYAVIDSAKAKGKNGTRALEYVLVHEMMHILFGHCDVVDSEEYQDLFRMNYAMDYEINYVIENYLYDLNGNLPFKGMTETVGGCYNESFGEEGLTWEEIYPRISIPERVNPRLETSDEWKKGFADGFYEIMSELRKNRLVERYEI